jgi:S-adenosylmethionine/arginine decarboxylase-like enzyme
MTLGAQAVTAVAGAYGLELVLDLHGCDQTRFNRASIDAFFDQLCELIEMEKVEVHFWDDVGVPIEEQQTLPHTKGTSAVCFILTSSIVIHTLDLLQAVYVNIFSCKPFDRDQARRFSVEWFAAKECSDTLLTRK